MKWLEGLRARLRLLLGRRAAEERMDEEFRFHLEMETERLVRDEGLDPKEARRRSRVAFGGVERYKQELRDGRGLGWLYGLSLDVKVGFRMLLKYPVLTLASVLALAIAVALAASWFEFMSNLAYPRLPLPDGERIVQVRNHDLETTDSDYSSEPRSLHDFEAWREEVTSIQDLSAASSAEYVVTTEDDRVATVVGARVTPSTFRVARVQPLLGRTLTEEDDRPESPPVAVLGYGAWQRLFDGDRTAVGRTVRLDSEHATVVGVMPEGFGFPVNHEIWTPLRERAVSYQRRQGPSLAMFGRLAPDATLEEAQAELDVLGRRAAAAFPDTHEHLRPEVRRFGRGNDMAVVATALNVPFLLFLLVVSANVATLLFARTSTRQSELAMRSALGASRRRLLLQLVAEAFVLTSVAAALGLTGAHFGLRWGMDLFWEVQQMRPPFWFDEGVSVPSVLYACALALVGALIIGGLPGLRATRRDLRERLTHPGAGGAGMRFGKLATGVIIVQVALCVAFIPVAVLNARELLPGRNASDFPAERFLTARLTHQGGPAALASGAGAGGEPDAGPVDARGSAEERTAAALFEEARHRLASEPRVLAASRADRVPGFNHPNRPIEMADDSTVIYARTLQVDPDWFEVVGARIVDGRPFRPEDVASAIPVMIVDETWARETFGGRNPIGRRIGIHEDGEDEATRWHEIVGVVSGVERAVGPGTAVRLFRPLRPEEHASVQLYLRTSGSPEALVPQVLDVVSSLDPNLAIAELKPLAEVWRPVERSDRFFAAALAVVSGIIVLFALMGIYALTSFTVERRAREIGIRTALGAGPRRILLSIFSRAAIQIGLGILAGGTLVSLTAARSPDGLRLVAGVALAMAIVGLLGCAVPAARALRIPPTEALRAE